MASGEATATVSMAVAVAEERFSWTSELIDAVLALRFTDAVVARAIDSAKGNEPKRQAWTALAAELHKKKGVDVSEAKIRRAVSKWQSQHRSWVQAMANKSPAELTQADRAPSYMPILHRYFQPGSSDAIVEKMTAAETSAEPTARPDSLTLSMEAFEAVIDCQPAAQTSKRARQDPSTSKIGTKQPETTAPPNPAPLVVTHIMAPRMPTLELEPPSPESTKAPQECVATVHAPWRRPTLIPHDSDEDPTTSQEDFQGMLLSSTTTDTHAEQPATKQRKITHEKEAAIPARPARVSMMPPLQTMVPILRTPDGTPRERQLDLRESAARITQQLANVHHEQLELQKKHFEEQLQLQRKQYEEQFAVQRKQVEALQAVVESLQGSAIV